MANKVEIDIQRMTHCKNRLAEITEQLNTTLNNAVEYLNGISSAIRSDEVHKQIEVYTAACNELNTETVKELNNLDSFLANQLAGYSQTNTTAMDELTNIQARLDNINI